MHDFASGKFAGVVRLWDAVMVASADRPLPRVILESGTGLRPSASAAAIGAAADRVGAALPASYAAFLSVSDGADPNGCGIVTRPGGDGLVPAAGISRLVEVASDHAGLWVEMFGAVGPEPRGGSGRRSGRRQLRRFRECCSPHGDGRRRL